MSRCVYEDKYFTVIAPELPLNCREDGGHLMLLKKEPVNDRSDLCYQEAIDFMRITMIVGRAMYDVLNIERMNYSPAVADGGSAMGFRLPSIQLQ